MSESANVSDIRARATELLSGLRAARAQTGPVTRGFWPFSPSAAGSAPSEPAAVPGRARQDEALTTLQMRLQTLETVLVNSAEFDDPTATVEMVSEAVASALATFEQVTGAGLLSALEEGYSGGASELGLGGAALYDGTAPTSDGGPVAALLGLIQQAQNVARTLTSSVTGPVEAASSRIAAPPGSSTLMSSTPNPPMPGVVTQVAPEGVAAQPGTAAQQQIAAQSVANLEGERAAGLRPAPDHALVQATRAAEAQTTANAVSVPRVSAAEIGVRATIAAPVATVQRPVDGRPMQPDLDVIRTAEASVAAPAKGEILTQALNLTAAIVALAQPTGREAMARRSGELPRFAALLPVAEAAHSAADTTRSATAPTAPTQSRFAEAIAAQIRTARVGEGLTRVELSPRGLGGIEIEVSSDRDGALNVVIRAENSAVLSALREMREPLADMLAMGTGGALSFEDKPTGQGGDHTGGLTDAQGETSAGEATAAADPSGQAAPLIDGRQLDIMT